MARYNPMQSVVGQAGLQLGGQGLAWEGRQRGLGRRAIQAYLNEQARKATKAGRGIGRSRFWGKLASVAAMAIPGWKESQLALQLLAGAGAGGAVTKVGSEIATKDLRMESGPDVLYGLPEKEKAESYAHSAVDTLLSEVDPGALDVAITTPLQYLTMKMLAPVGSTTEVAAGGEASATAGGEALVAAGGEGAKFAAGDFGKLYSAGQAGYKQKGFQDLLSLIGGGTRSGGDIPFKTLGTDISNYFNNPYLRL
jgi:hypothetical protein